MKQFYALTTDHLLEYKGITDELGVTHQLCIFHLFDMIGKRIYKFLKSKKVTRQDKICLCLYSTEIKNISRTYNENTVIIRLEELLNKFHDIPYVLQQFIEKSNS